MILTPTRFRGAPRLALTAALVLSLSPFRPLTGQEPLAIQVTKGSGAIAPPGGNFGEIEVEVRQGARPVPGATVTFIVPSVGAGAAFADGSGISILNTDDQGRAIARGIKANQQEGEYALRVNASFQGQVVSLSVPMKNGAAPEEPAAPAPAAKEEPGKAPPPAVAPKPTPRPVAKKKSNTGVIAGVVGGGGAAVLLGLLLGGGTKGCPEDPSKCPPPNRSISISAGAPNIGRP